MIKINKSSMAIFLCYCLVYIGNVKLLFSQIGWAIEILQYIIIVASALYIIKYKLLSGLRYNKTMWLLIAFFILYFCSAISSPNSVSKRTNFITAVIDLVFFVLIYYISQNINLQKYIYVANKTNLVLILLYIIIFGKSILSYATSHSRMEDVEANPIWVARFAGDIFICCFMYSFIHKSKTSRWMAIMAIVPTALILLVTGSKGPVLAIGISLIFFYFSQQSFKARKTRYFFLFSVIAVIAYIAISIFGIGGLDKYFRISSMMSNQQGYRMERFGYAISRIKTNPLWGFGLGSWALDYNKVDIYDYPHNALLEIWFEAGLLALIVFLCFSFSLVVKKATKKAKYAHLFSCVALYYFINAMFSGGLVTGNKNVFTFVVLASTALDNYYKDSVETFNDVINDTSISAMR